MCTYAVGRRRSATPKNAVMGTNLFKSMNPTVAPLLGSPQVQPTERVDDRNS